MLDLIKKAAEQVNSNNQPMRMMEAVVVEQPPELKIMLLENKKLIIPKDLLIVSEHLTNHKRMITLRKVTDERFKEGYNPPFESRIRFLEMVNVQEDFDFVDIECEFLDELKKDDRVLVYSFPGFQKFYIGDRIKSYSNESEG
ncbi:DUF2577 family protein [Heyndrickxia oleronia]|uniref:DUF2577 family protein n=1 Tax=Heyndrickxia oleronia TaxID=38875 RepID=UPI001B05B0E9|nr:DUF2577 family protein [Heyndrickxia oleronia]GIN39054.1 hypothetical protein J19TS1_20030 [Heyndrickxia oleronia]